MEELLASIRKAIHDDIGEAPASTSAQSAGTLYKGSTRELHVKASDDHTSAAAEIQELRDRINRTRASEARRETVTLPPSPASYAPGMLSGEGEARRAWRLAEAAVPPVPPLRKSFAEQELSRPEPRRDFAARLEREVEERQASRQPVQHSFEPTPAYAPPPEPRYAREPARELSLLAPDAEAAAGAAFSRLAETILSRATGDRGIEDMTRDLLRGMLKQWLDDNLPGLVERLVREEIERVARRGR